MDIKSIVVESAKQLGYENLQDKQIGAVTTLLEGYDTFVSLLTGYGKSVKHAVLPFAFDNKGTKGYNPQCYTVLCLYVAHVYNTHEVGEHSSRARNNGQTATEFLCRTIQYHIRPLYLCIA